MVEQKGDIMRKMLGFLAVAVLVIGGAAVALAQTEDAPEGENAVEKVFRGGQMLADVLADLVTDGTINQGQADAIVAAVEEQHTLRMQEREAFRAQMEEFWADEVLTPEELAQLPEGHPFLSDEFAEAAADGLTKDEIRELAPRGPGGFHRHRGPGGPGGGPGGFGPGLQDSGLDA